MAIEEKKALAVQMIRSLPSGDFSSFAFAPQFWAWTATSGRLDKDEFLRRVSMFGAVFKTSDIISIDHVIGEGDQIVVQFRVHGILLNGSVYKQSAVFMVEFDGDKTLRHWREYFDTRIVAEVLFPAMQELQAR